MSHGGRKCQGDHRKGEAWENDPINLLINSGAQPCVNMYGLDPIQQNENFEN